MTKKKVYRQGDVFLARCRILPKNARRLEHTILARGEATGHCHRVIGNAELYERDGTLYLKVNEQAELRHQEHDPITLPMGAYEIGIQKEYQPEGWTRVID